MFCYFFGMGQSRLILTQRWAPLSHTECWTTFTEPCFVFVKIFAWNWPGFNFSLLFFCQCFSAPLSVLKVLWRKWMAILVFYLHKEHRISISQSCCYSFSTDLIAENKDREEGICAGVLGFSVVEVVHSFTPHPLSLHMLFCQFSNCSTHADLQG